jgi:hypothetical protein
MLIHSISFFSFSSVLIVSYLVVQTDKSFFSSSANFREEERLRREERIRRREGYRYAGTGGVEWQSFDEGEETAAAEQPAFPFASPARAPSVTRDENAPTVVDFLSPPAPLFASRDEVPSLVHKSFIADHPP